ncbi:MAG: hypothetical protein IPM34_11695 [Saprospiraceae bacterium]|nr:hypothetical protein [Saprospiraceae bacterium]
MQKYEICTRAFFSKMMVTLSVVLLTGMVHPFYLGLSEIRYHPENKQLEISIKLFTDDFEKCLSSHSRKNIRLFAPDNGPEVDTAISQYVDTHFQIYKGRTKLQLQYVGYEKSEEATWSYFEIPLTSLPENLEIKNSLLYDCITGQSNILHLKSGDHQKSYKLNYPDSIYHWQTFMTNGE